MATNETLAPKADMYGSAMDIRVLGPVEVSAGDLPLRLGGPKQRAVLAVLISHAGNVVPVDTLIHSVWGESRPEAARTSLHTYVSNLRSITQHDIERVGGGYRLDVSTDSIDAATFERLLDEGRRSLSVNPGDAAATLRSALALWRGRPYADLVDVVGLEDEIRRLEQLRALAVEARIDADLELGRHHALIGELEALTVENPLDEGLRRRHMIALYRDGRQAEALRAYQQTRQILGSELGVDPSPQLQQLEDRILQHDPGLLAAQDTQTHEVAFMITDLVGSTALWETRPEQMRDALARHDEILSSAVDKAGGRIFKHTGDGVLAAFSTAAAAADAAGLAQRSMSDTDWGELGRLEMRVGVDIGEVNVQRDDYFGAPLNRGARLMASAHGGQIVLSAAARRHLEHEAGVQIKQLGEHRFKGLGTPQQVFQLVVQGLESEFPELQTDASAPSEARSFGDAIRGYELRQRLGVGRFGIVYQAYQPSVGREVAIKVIRPEYANHPVFVRRFEAEARLVAKLEHPHIVSLYDYWRDHEGAYLVMPYLAGSSLAGAPFGALAPERVVAILQQVGSGLSYAHRHGVIHRDVKPANLLLDSDGNAYLGDFGVAVRAVEQATGAQPSSQAYRAPEDRDGAAIDERIDIYALAAVTAEMLVGRPFDGGDLSAVPRSVRTVLARGLASDPADRYQTVDDMVQALATAAGAAVPAATTVGPTRNPFKGLAAFDESDARDFFGRDAEVAELIGLVEQKRLVTVVGPSGSGKSSLARAGLVPSIRNGGIAGSDGWLVVTVVPGAHPFDELATALGDVATESMGDLAAELQSDEHGLMRVTKRVTRDIGGEVLLLVDQFEELYTLPEASNRRLFIDSLIEATTDPHSRLRVVATIRADFFDEPLLHDRLGGIVADAHLALAVPGRQALTEAVERPAAGAGVDLEPGLASRIVSDVVDEPGGLPLMQFVLSDLAQRADQSGLTNAMYDESGGVSGALSRRADDVFTALAPADQAEAERILLRLVTVSDDSGDARRRVRRVELESVGSDAGAVARVLDAFGAARLLTFDRDPVTRGPTVAVAHEALLREWARYRAWIDGRRAELVLRRRFELAFGEWEAAERAVDLLPTGGRLAQFEEWADGERLGQQELGFLDAAIERRQAEREERRRRRRRVMGGFAAAAAVAVVLAVAAWVQRNEAARGEALASARAMVFEAREQLQADPELSILLALESIELFDQAGAPSHSAASVLRLAMQRHDVVWRAPGGRFVDVDTTEQLLATSDGNDVVVWDIASRTVVEEYRREDGAVAIDAEFSPDGRHLAVAYKDADEYVRLWNRANRTSRDFGGPTGPMESTAISFSLDGQSLAFEHTTLTGQPGAVQLWSVSPLRSIHQRAGNTGYPAFTPDGQLVYGDCPEGVNGCVVRFVDTATGDVAESPPLPIETLFVSPSPDGHTMLIGGQNTISVVDADSWKIMAQTDLDRVAFPRWLGSRPMFVSSGESTTRVISADTGEVRRELLGLSGAAWSTDVFSEGNRVAVASILGGETAIFDASMLGAPEVSVSSAPIKNIWTANYADATGSMIVADGGAFSVDDGQSLVVLDSAGDPVVSATGAEGRWFPWASRRGELVTFREESGTWTARSTTTGDVVFTAPRGSELHGVNDSGTRAVVVIGEIAWLIRAGESPIMLDMGAPGQVVFDADSRKFVTWSFSEGENIIFDADTGERLAAIGDTLGGLALDFTWDSTRVVTAGFGTLNIFSVEDLLAGESAEDSLITTIEVGANLILRVAVASDDSMVLASAWNEALKVFSLETGALLGEFGEKLTGQTLNNGDFHPTLPHLLVTSPPNIVRVHTLDLDELERIARESLTRDFTQDECTTFEVRDCEPGDL